MEAADAFDSDDLAGEKAVDCLGNRGVAHRC